MHRRDFLQFAVLALGAACEAHGGHGWGLPAAPPSRFKLAAISDGFSQDFEKALKIMKGYGLSWVEIRGLWGKYNTDATPEEIRRVKDLLERYNFRCSVVDSGFYKCVLPGTKPVSIEGGYHIPFPGQMDLLKRAMDRGHAWSTDKVRIFTFWRVAQPDTIYRQISEELAKVADVAKGEGGRLVIENEESCNAATGRELAAILKLAPATNLGYNWDVGNGYDRGEVSYPDGYNALEKGRIWNIHLKGMHCQSGLKQCEETFADSGEIDLVGQLRALRRDNYNETMSLECEFNAPGMNQQQTTERSLQGLLRVINQAQ